ncbi:MAG: cyclophilin-like fold protein [Candidatus Geothermarchaeales archaeon]
MPRIKIIAGDVELTAELNASETASKIYEALPIRGRGNRWGDEIYFSIPVEMGSEEDFSRAVVEKGDLGYWPPGSAFCIFFGPTPASRGDEIRPASEVNVFGRVLGDVDRLKKLRSGEEVRIERAD